MNKNIKIAKELIKIAKNLIANNGMASQPGKYQNFTGNIMFYDTQGRAQNATFELMKNKMIHWEKGDFTGLWGGGLWEDGTFNGGSWIKGTWMKGTWKKGDWQDGIWQDGKWENGKWSKGYDKNDNYHDRNDSPDNW